jgi:hypothetical protein
MNVELSENCHNFWAARLAKLSALNLLLSLLWRV